MKQIPSDAVIAECVCRTIQNPHLWNLFEAEFLSEIDDASELEFASAWRAFCETEFPEYTPFLLMDIRALVMALRTKYEQRKGELTKAQRMKLYRE